MASLKSSQLWASSFGLTKRLAFIRPFLAMASLKSSQLWASSFGLTKRLAFIRPFLAMASLKACQLWRCSFGLTKRLLQPAWWQGNLRRQSSVSPSPASYMMARCLPAAGALSSAVCNVAHGRGQRAEPVFATDFPLEAMERRGEEADNSVPSSSFGHLRASKGGGGVSICEIMPIFAVRHFTQCIE